MSAVDESFFPRPMDGASGAVLRPVAAPVPRGATRLSRNLLAMTADGVGCNLMVGLGETHLPAFILFLGMGGVAAGLLSTLPVLAGAILQLAAPWGVRRCGSHKAWVVVTAVIQALSLLAVLSAAQSGTFAPLVVFAAATLYWASGLASAPAWNTWVEEIVPKGIRARFFGRRQRFCQAGLFAGFVAGGLALHFGASHNETAAVFVCVFGMAAACRLFSAWCMAQQTAPVRPIEEETISLVDVVRGVRHDAGAKLLAYLFVVQAMVQFSGPYFTPFMFRELKLSFFEFTLLIAIAFLGKIVASPFYGRLAQRIGARNLLWVGGTAIVPISGLWVFSQSLPYLAMIQFLSGVAWAAYELAFFLMFFEAIPRTRRTSVLTVYNFTNSTAMVAGSLVAAATLYSFGESYNGYLMLFGLSSLGRLAALALLFRLTPTTSHVGWVESASPSI